MFSKNLKGMLLRFSCLEKKSAMNLRDLPFRYSSLDKDSLKLWAREGILSEKKNVGVGPQYTIEQTYNLIHKNEQIFKIIVPTCTERDSYNEKVFQASNFYEQEAGCKIYSAESLAISYGKEGMAQFGAGRIEPKPEVNSPRGQNWALMSMFPATKAGWIITWAHLDFTLL